MINPFLHRSNSYPIKLLVDIHSYCNARCTMCPYPRYSRKQSQGQMTWSLYEAVIDEFARIGRQNHFRPTMTYCYMGEPFLSDDLHRYVRLALENDIDVYLNTNASAMTPEKIDALLETGFNGRFNISFHGITPAVYERIMGLDYQTSLNNILYLLDRSDPKNILIRGVDDHWPQDEKSKWLQFWQNKNVQLEYLPPISRCGSIKRLLPKKSQNKNEQKQRGTVKLYGCQCNHPLVEMVILFDGRAVMCCQDMGRELIWGDVGKDGILGVWNNTTRKKTLQMLYSGKPVPNTFLCSRCEQALGPIDLIQSITKTAWRKLTHAASL